MTYELISPVGQAQWDVYHNIRRIILFEARGRFGIYDRRHPDEFKANHFPKLLLFEKTPVGVIRIDIDGGTARLRRVAVAAEEQRRGHGRRLLALSEAFARDHNALSAEASVAADAVEFYHRCGYQALGVLDQAGSVRMSKDLTLA